MGRKDASRAFPHDTRDTDERRSFRRTGDERDGKKKKYDMRSLLLLILVVGGGLQGLSSMVNALTDLFTDPYERVFPDDSVKLGEVFFSGHPWVVLCHNGTGPINQVFTKAARVNYNEKSEWLRPKYGVLDCLKPLPAGKNTLDRFNLGKPSKSDIVFVVSNGQKPELVPSGWYQAGKEGDSNSRDKAADNLVRYVMEHTAPVPLRYAATSADLRKLCFEKKHCGVILHPGRKPNNSTQRHLNSIVTRFRSVRFVLVNVKEMYLSPLEPKLPAVPDGVKPYPRFLYFRRTQIEADKKSDSNAKSKATDQPIQLFAKAHRDGFNADAVSLFLSEMLGDAADTKMARLERFPVLRSRKHMGKESEKKQDGGDTKTFASSNPAKPSKGNSERKPPNKGDDRTAREEARKRARSNSDGSQRHTRSERTRNSSPPDDERESYRATYPAEPRRASAVTEDEEEIIDLDLDGGESGADGEEEDDSVPDIVDESNGETDSLSDDGDIEALDDIIDNMSGPTDDIESV